MQNVMMSIRNVARGLNIESPEVVKEILGMHRMDVSAPAPLMHCLNAEEIAKFNRC